MKGEYAELVSDDAGCDLKQIDITSDNFLNNFEKVVYHLDQPVAGPGSFPQFMVSELASKHVKVVLGGQGGDELFGGYARYLIAYFEQKLRDAIDGDVVANKNDVSLESILPNLSMLKEYKPLIKTFFQKGLFEPVGDRYFRLTNRSNDFAGEFNWETIDIQQTKEQFDSIFHSNKSIAPNAYFNQVMHFDFKCLLPALLHVEDRMSMAHSIESRVPLLDHNIVEFSASVPANIKFPGGKMKHMLRSGYKDLLPNRLTERRDKMGFPVPLANWYKADLKEYVLDTFSSTKSKNREMFNTDNIIAAFEQEAEFSRKTWGLLNLEVWQQQFHDQERKFQSLLD